MYVLGAVAPFRANRQTARVMLTSYASDFTTQTRMAGRGSSSNSSMDTRVVIRVALYCAVAQVYTTYPPKNSATTIATVAVLSKEGAGESPYASTRELWAGEG